MRMRLMASLLVLLAGSLSAAAAEPLRVGIIGTDAHALPWTKILSNPKAEGELADMKIVAAWPGGSPDIPQSVELLNKSVEPIREMGVEIVDSIDALLEKVDGVLILSIDGRTHLEFAKKVFAVKKPVFIDKPVGGCLADALEIYRLAEKAGVPIFSSSALRFAPGTQAVLGDPKVGDIVGCDAFSPCGLEPHHPDFYWYGVHGCETLFTIMGTGCRSVSRTHSDDTDVAVGTWEDGRIGTFRGTRKGRHAYGATVFGMKGIVQAGNFEGYEPLVAEIVKFFKTGKPPLSAQTTIEIMAFMEAADESKRQGGRPVTLQSVLEKDRQINAARD
ncbi:MAG: Gfo/Idh/MocA family oxidoreductase [Rhodopirellula sp.]|nr:Gfo/Idh/MocA family oxidoreductase [Rhodopirellula sp.]